MSTGLNKVQLIGYLGATPELRFTQAKQGILNFRLAVSETWFDATTKEKKERTEWISCVLWGKRGEALNNFLDKGSRVYVEGQFTTRSWEDKEGSTRYSSEVNVRELILLDGKDKADQKGEQSKSRAREPSEPKSRDAVDSMPLDDEIPF